MKTLSYNIVGVVISVLLVFAIAVPIVGGLQEQTGDKITEKNTAFGKFKYDYGTEYTGEFSNSDGIDTISINGVEYNRPAFGFEIVLLTNNAFMVMYASNFASGTLGNIIWHNGTSAQSLNIELNDSATVTLSDSVLTITHGSTVITLDVEWAAYPQENGRFVQVESTDGVILNKNWKNGVIFSYNYGTETVKDYVSYSNGKISTHSPINGEYSYIAIDKEGTTDLLIGGFNLELNEGEYSSTYSATTLLALENIEGHANQGVLYTLVGLLPVLLMVSVIMGAIALVIIHNKN